MSVALRALAGAAGQTPGGGNGGGEPEPSTLLGVGSDSNSLTTYPKTGSVTTGDIWVDPSAVSNGTGTEGSPYDNLSSAFTAVSDGQRIIVRTGVINGTISRSVNWTTGVEVFAYGDERPIIDANGGQDILTLGGQNEHWKGFEFRNATRFTVFIQDSNNTIEDCWGHDGGSSGFYIFGTSPTGNVVKDCRGWNFGPAGSSGVDVFKAAGPDTSNLNQGGNAFVRCYAKWGGDDNYDLYNSNSNSIIDCVSHRAGYVYTTSEQAGNNGNGFKLGGGGSTGGHTLSGCVSYNNKMRGVVDQNIENTITRCTSVDNEYIGFQATDAATTMKNNIAEGNTDGSITPGSIDGTYNSWNDPADAGGDAAFPLSSAEIAFADAANYDFSLDTGSDAIDAADDAGNLGASTIALEIAKEWIAKDLTT